MMIKDEIFITTYQCQRTLHIYKPDDLKDGEKLPVLYIFDGHNPYCDNEATFGKCRSIKD